MNNAFPFSQQHIMSSFGKDVYSDSFVVYGKSAFWLEKTPHGKQLSIISAPNNPMLSDFQGKQQSFKKNYALKRCPAEHANSKALRNILPWLKPVLLGLNTSAGMGDRLGLATAGHARAIRSLPKNSISPVFAQQSIREMERTGRTPDDVMNDATWGMFQNGLQCKIGADADHLKTTADIDLCAEAGFTLFTIDPSAYVDNEADTSAPNMIKEKVNALPWNILESTSSDLEHRYKGIKIDLEPVDFLKPRCLVIEKEDIMRAAAKYGGAVAHVASMARHLAGIQIKHELEVSVDETEMPTSLVEHIYIASELKRLNVEWVSLAPRYVGRFEKGVDYIGNLETIGRHLAGHAAIARTLGSYKLSLHSGSDKFSIYSLMSRACGNMVHLKTAGTSYVEALRVIAGVDPKFFRDIAKLAVERYPEDKATYHVSAELRQIPDFADISDEQLPKCVDDHNIRQALHVTFGSALNTWGTKLKEALKIHEEKYYEILKHHFIRHLEPFLNKTGAE